MERSSALALASDACTSESSAARFSAELGAVEHALHKAMAVIAATRSQLRIVASVREGPSEPFTLVVHMHAAALKTRSCPHYRWARHRRKDLFHGHPCWDQRLRAHRASRLPHRGRLS